MPELDLTGNNGGHPVEETGVEHAAQNHQNTDDLALLESAVRAAGDIARKFYGGDFKRWSKEGGSPVSEADLAVDRYLQSTLLAARPGYGWLSEESPDNKARLTTKRVFVVDPIDGTVAFLKQRPHFTICAAVVEAGRPLSAIVFNPISEECFAAVLGGGATLNGAPIHVTARGAIAGARMLGPKSTFETGWPEVEVTSFSSIAYRIVLVAAGRYDAAVSISAKRDWDLAAADLIVREAGGSLTDRSGATLYYNRASATQNSAIAAGAPLHALLLAHLRQ